MRFGVRDQRSENSESERANGSNSHQRTAAAACRFAGVNWNFDDCNVKFSTTLGTITGFEDQAVDGTTTENRTNGNLDFAGSISGPLNAAQLPSSGSPAIVAGAVLTNLKIWLDKAIAPRFCGCNYVIVESITYHPNEADAAQRVTIEVKSGGASGAGNTVLVTYPT